MSETLSVTGHLDWLTLTKTNAKSPKEIIPPIEGIELLESMNPPKRFDRAWQIYPAGMVATQSNGYETAMLWLTGKDLEVWREVGIHESTMLKAAATLDPTCTRLDYCLNVYGSGSVAECATELAEGRREGRPKPYGRFQKFDDAGDTLYFGAPKSDQRITIYNKAAQMGIDDLWTRIELRCRKKKATPLLRDMAYYNYHYVGRQRIRELVMFPELDWYKEAVEGAKLDLTRVHRKPPATIKWLYESVMPVFEKQHEPDVLRELQGWLSNANIALRNANTDIDTGHQ